MYRVIVPPVSLSLKRVSEELTRTDRIRWMFLSRESNVARTQPTMWRVLGANQTELI